MMHCLRREQRDKCRFDTYGPTKTNLTTSFKPAEMVSGSKKLPLLPTITLIRISCNYSEIHIGLTVWAISWPKTWGREMAVATRHHAPLLQDIADNAVNDGGKMSADRMSGISGSDAPCYVRRSVLLFATRVRVSERVGIRYDKYYSVHYNNYLQLAHILL
jgi:hypothetical protein